MKGLYNLVKRKKGVSPVIAVVLLIALTVAAAAVIWAITQGLIGGVVSVNIETSDTDINAGVATWIGTIDASEEGTISFRLFNSTTSVDGVITNGAATVPAGSETSYTVTFTPGSGAFVSGSYTLEVSVSVDGEATLTETGVSL